MLENEYISIPILDQRISNKILNVDNYIKNKCKKINLINDVKIFK